VKEGDKFVFVIDKISLHFTVVRFSTLAHRKLMREMIAQQSKCQRCKPLTLLTSFSFDLFYFKKSDYIRL